MIPQNAQLPVPDQAAAAHSARLAEQLRARIREAGGWLDFASFMQHLLYAPGLGYYAAGSARFQQAGDFTTAPETSPLFGRTLARAIAPLLRALGPAAQLLEPGAGSGRLAEVLLPALAELDALPARYAILEPSPALRAEQRERLATLAPGLAARVDWVDDLPKGWSGVLLANEVLDAMPVHRLEARADGLHEHGVTLSGDGSFAWQTRPAGQALRRAVDRLAAPPLPGARFELGLAAMGWARTVAEGLQAGAVVLVDYGDPARALHQPHRAEGTLRCFYRHHVHGDPFFLPGLQDVTAHVDFSAIAAALEQGGLQLHEYDSQAAFLLGHGVLETLDPGLEPGSVAWLRQTGQLQKLVSPAEMGEAFKVLVALRDPAGRLAEVWPAPGPEAVRLRLGITGNRHNADIDPDRPGPPRDSRPT